eukprot:TRINITY_DN255_c0_g3_i1.p1 TRINITY_DN255_c0_g3~~TRINITY_DN255_c0_g3_i1.p1  ORF type:complete len:519 (-),score=86.09 TRINITY_DN255_c0_g3_i1:12-1568(-)
MASQDEDLPLTQPQVTPNSPTNNDTGYPVTTWGLLMPLHGNNPTKFELNKDTNIGRSRKCVIRLNDPRVSAVHCNITRSYSGDVILKDLSSNGTWVNGTLVGKNNVMSLRSGDKISLVHKSANDDGLIYVFTDLTNQPNQREECEVYKEYDMRASEQIGSGAFSSVCSAVNRTTGERVAVKIIDRNRFWQNQKQMEFLEREKKILSRVKHPNITSVYGIFESKSHIYIVMELARGGELFKKILDDGSYSESVARRLFTQLLDAMEYLHSQGIVHRDLKPENILLQDNGPNPVLKITDFGLATFVSEAAKMNTMCGTPQYVAPEILRGGSYGKEVDLWSLGAILYIMLSGLPPFYEDQEEPLFQQILQGHYDFPPEFWSEVSNNAKDIVRQLMTVDPKARMTIQQARIHPWMMKRTLSQAPLPIRANRQLSLLKLPPTVTNPTPPLLHCSEEYQSSGGPNSTNLDDDITTHSNNNNTTTNVEAGVKRKSNDIEDSSLRTTNNNSGHSQPPSSRRRLDAL